MKVYAFDVDDTLKCSKGPVDSNVMLELRDAGNIVGICGNIRVFIDRVPEWHKYASFLTPFPGQDKAVCLIKLKQWIKADDYIMVGNIKGVSGSSDDMGAAKRAGWRFIQEKDFATGVR